MIIIIIIIIIIMIIIIIIIIITLVITTIISEIVYIFQPIAAGQLARAARWVILTDIAREICANIFEHWLVHIKSVLNFNDYLIDYLRKIVLVCHEHMYVTVSMRKRICVEIC